MNSVAGGLDILPLLGLALTAALIAVFLKESRMTSAALLVSLTAGALILLALLGPIRQLLTVLGALAVQAGAQQEQLALVLRVIGLAYLAEFGAQLCRDAGEGAAAFKIELAAKVGVLLLSLPLLAGLIDTVSALLPP